MATVSFFIGLALLFVGLGASGWIGSHALALFTNVVAGVTGLVSLVILFQFMS